MVCKALTMTRTSATTHTHTSTNTITSTTTLGLPFSARTCTEAQSRAPGEQRRFRRLLSNLRWSASYVLCACVQGSVHAYIYIYIYTERYAVEGDIYIYIHVL